MITFLILLAVTGFVIGGLARLAVPGPDPMPWWGTILLGIAGSYLAGFVTWALWGRGPGFFVSLLGAVLLVVAYRKLVQKRPLTGPEAKRVPGA